MSQNSRKKLFTNTPERLSSKIIKSFDFLVTAGYLLYLTLSYVSQFWNVLSNVSFIKHVSQETSLSKYSYYKRHSKIRTVLLLIIILHHHAVNESATAAPRVAMTKKIMLTFFSFKVLQYNITETSPQSSVYLKKSK